jgi:hypothetical protein
VALALLAAGVLLAHALVLGAGWPRDAAPSPPPARALTVRQVAPAAVPLAAPQVPAVLAAVPEAPARRRPPAPLATPAVAPAAEAAPPPDAPALATEAPMPALPSAPLAAPAEMAEPPPLLAVAASLPTQVPGADTAPPTYRTRVPPSAVLQYELRRGALTGAGELRWQRSADAYELSIEGSVFGLTVLSQTSRGGFDAAGLAPVRFVDRRRGRELRAANFQRDRGLITYSGSEARYPLVAGAQDRLSWMIQLAAIVDAEPARFRPGAEVEMAVSGSRGDTDVWTFAVAGVEAIDLAGGGRVERALALRREPRKPFDTHVDVWLDPGRHHLPVRIRLSNDRGAEALEFVLRP